MLAYESCFSITVEKKVQKISTLCEIKHLQRTEQVCWSKNISIHLCAIISYCTFPQFSQKLASCSVYTWSGGGVHVSQWHASARMRVCPYFQLWKILRGRQPPLPPWFLCHCIRRPRLSSTAYHMIHMMYGHMIHMMYGHMIHVMYGHMMYGHAITDLAM